MLIQVSKKVCELLSLEYDFAIDFKNKEQIDVVMKDQTDLDRVLGMQTSFERFAANLSEDHPDAKMMEEVNNLQKKYHINDHEKMLKDLDNSMNVEVDD
jgi:hypothetical protein